MTDEEALTLRRGDRVVVNGAPFAAHKGKVFVVEFTRKHKLTLLGGGHMQVCCRGGDVWAASFVDLFSRG